MTAEAIRTPGSVQVGLVRDEIVKATSTIAVDVPPEANLRQLTRAIGVPGVDGEVRRTGPSSFVWAPRTSIPPGAHTFVVSAFADSGFRAISQRLEIPFHVVDTLADFPASLRVETFTRICLLHDGFLRLSSDSIPEGVDYIDVLKAVNRADNMPVPLAFDPEGKEIDGELVLAERRKALTDARGKVDPAVHRRLALEPGKKIFIDAWFEIDEPEPEGWERPLEEPGDSPIFERRALELIERIRQRASEIVEKLARSVAQGVEFLNPMDRAPVVSLRVRPEDVSKVAELDDITAVFLHEKTGINDLSESIFIARTDLVHLAGQKGEGVRVAVWENGPPDKTNLDIVDEFTRTPAPDAHSQIVHAVIRNKRTGAANGHAPMCDLFSANSMDRAALTWAVEVARCSVINQSFHRTDEPLSSMLCSEDLYKDWLATHWPYPLIVHAAGNIFGDEDDIDPPTDEYVNHKGYNTISVANHNDDASLVDWTSASRNPQSSHADRELPELSANGSSVTADALTLSGTSLSSPAVAGVASLIQGTDSILTYWPEGCRAILLASASPKASSRTWWQEHVAGIDGVDGAGALNAEESFEIAQWRARSGAAAMPRGWDIGCLKPADCDPRGEAVFSYSLTVPGGGVGTRTVRVALAWSSRTSHAVDYWSHLGVDLDLKVYDSTGVQVGYSGSWDNSYEIAEFVGRASETYTVKIRSWSARESTWYGIAWTAAGSPVSANRPPVSVVTSQPRAEPRVAQRSKSRWPKFVATLWARLKSRSQAPAS